MSCWNRNLISVLMLSGTVLFAPPLIAEDAAEEGSSKLQVHGFLTQAFGISDGLQILGIPDDGTTEMRSGALQLRYALTENDEFVVQASHELVGESGSNVFREDIELDWLFYRREVGASSEIKIGRVPLPIGIYNEIKDVGTLLPFYRPSTNYYGESTWTSDTIDGVVLSHGFAQGSPWSLNLAVYYGQWERIESDPGTGSFGVADIDNAVGFWLWLNTPVSGLRFGVGANRFDACCGLFLPPGVEDEEETLFFSVDGQFDPIVVRAEASERTFSSGHWRVFYAEIAARVAERLKIVARFDHAELKFTVPFFAVFDDDYSENIALGMNYIVRNNLVLKLEHHWFEGYGEVEEHPLNFFADAPVKIRYAILSLSLHF